MDIPFLRKTFSLLAIRAYETLRLFMRNLSHHWRIANMAAGILAFSSVAGQAYTVVTISTGAPTNLEKQFLASTTAQFQGLVTPNPSASNTYALKLFGLNPNYKASAPLTLEQSLFLGATVYVYGFANGMTYQQQVEEGSIGTLGNLCDSATAFMLLQASPASFDRSTCQDVIATIMNQLFQMSLSTPSVIPPVSSAASFTIWSDSDVPAIVSSDPGTLEVGVRFRSDVPGFITGIRFYKSLLNTGVHYGDLWSNTGTPLAKVQFTNETASGWQTALYPSPIAIIPGTTYVASYHIDKGYNAYDPNYFVSGYDNPPLHALKSGVDGPNGVYAFTDTGTPRFPFNATTDNYWVDVVFKPAT
jgi:hypothetical protein